VAYRKSALPNGIRLVTETMPHVRSVAVGIWVETGSRLEPEPLGGISHLIEHLVFKGTATRSAEEIARAIDSVGGQMDAFTAKEHTCFYVQVLDEHLPLAVSLLTDILRQPLFAPADIEKEKAVVLQEIKMVEDTPDDLIHDLFAEQVWAGHPLGRPILGRWDVVKEFDRDTVLGYFEREYVPGRIVVAVAGHAEHERVADLFAAGFEGWGRPAVPHAFVPPTLHPGIHTVQKPLEQVHLVLGLPGVSDTAADRYPLYLLNDIIGGSMSSRLFQEIRERQALVYSVHSGQQAYRDTGLFYVYAGTDPANFGKVLQALMKEIRRDHRRRAGTVQGASQGEPDALAGVHVVSNEPVGLARDAVRLVHVHGRDAGRDRPRADGRGGRPHPPRARRGAALAADPGSGGAPGPPPRPDALLRRRR
jgi:predicted Zn-dependent peptidase